MKIIIGIIALIAVFIFLQGFVNSHCIGGHYYGTRSLTSCASQQPPVYKAPNTQGDV